MSVSLCVGTPTLVCNYLAAQMYLGIDFEQCLCLCLCLSVKLALAAMPSSSAALLLAVYLEIRQGVCVCVCLCVALTHGRCACNTRMRYELTGRDIDLEESYVNL